LDEANRLSPDNLGVLFDLCQSLELQLLIGRPRGRARRRQHHLPTGWRTVTDDGREEVIVSGRRAAMPASPASIGREPVTPEAGQGVFRSNERAHAICRPWTDCAPSRCLAVIGFHAELPRLGGGFLGVEVFFVVSGYLITSLLLLEQCGSGRISLPQFWLRRARRLLPAVCRCCSLP